MSALEDAGLYPVAGGMVKLDGFEGLEPLAVWDCTDSGGTWWTAGHLQRVEWAKANMPRANDTVRLDFYLLDAPFAVAYRTRRNGDGVKWAQDGGPVMDEPAIVPLAELPPKHLLETR